MKRNLMRIFIMVVSIISLLCGLCYADLIDPMFPYDRSGSSTPKIDVQRPETVNSVPLIIIGIVIVVIGLVAIIILVKSKNNKDKEVNNEK